MNRIVLIGRLTKDPELRYTQSGTAVCNFTLAVNRAYVRDGEQEADFVPCQVWGKSAENCAKYLAKGRQAAVDGRLQIRSYEDKEGTRRWVTEVVAERVEFLGSGSGQRESREEEFGTVVEYDGAFERGASQIAFDDE